MPDLCQFTNCFANTCGPANATHLFATYAYQLGIGTGLLAEGAAISLAMFPFLFVIVVVQLLYIRRVETR